MATYDLTSSIPSKIATGDILNCPYSGAKVILSLPKGVYQLEVWGAQGGSGTYSSGSYSATGGKGGYAKGTVVLNDITSVHLYAGGQGSGGDTTGTYAGGFNGGGSGYRSSAAYITCGGGGGSDVRIGTDSLYARIIVAGGGGGANSYSTNSMLTGGVGGGTSGETGEYYSSSYPAGTGGSATVRGRSYYGTTADSTSYGTLAAFGLGASGTGSQSAGGGSGWYGGGYSRRGGGGGGSGYVYTSSSASNYPSGCLLDSSMYLTDTVLTAGDASMPSISGSTETGHSGNGYVRITVIKIASGLPIRTKISSSIVEATGGYVKVSDAWKEINGIFIKKDGEWIGN